MAKLTHLTLQNYRNIPSIDIEFEGKDGKIIGGNRIGKTNCIEAICYLLTDKLLGGSADIPSIKPQSNSRLKVVVEGTFVVNDGAVTLRKEFYEKWVRPRGSATDELQGHVTDYFINGAKQARAKDFFEALSEKFGIPTDLNGLDVYQLLIDPFYLGESICASKDWKMARKAIIDIVGDVDANEIYVANPQTKIAHNDLQLHQFNDAEAKKAIRGEIDDYKRRMTENEGLLAEYERTIAQDASEEEYKNAKAEEEKLNDQIAQLKLGVANPYADEVTALQNELYSLNEKYNKAATAPSDHSESEALRKELNRKKDEFSKKSLESRTVQYEYDRLKNDLKEKKEIQEAYKSTLKDLGLQDKSIMVEENCPTCGQRLPEEKIQEAYNKRKAEISAEAQRVRELAVANKKRVDTLTEQIQNFQSENYNASLSTLESEISELEKKLMEANAKEQASIKAPDPAIKARIGEINARLSEIQNAQREGNQNAALEIEKLKMRKSDLNAIFSKRIAAENAKKRISEIQTDNVKVGNAQADAEQRLWAVGEFVKTKLSLLDKHMSDKLGAVRFQLIKENIKAGSYDEVCMPYIINPIDGSTTKTLFSDGSKSEQIFTGIQIIKAIRDAKNWNPLPVIFDQGGELDSRSTLNVSLAAEAQIIEVKVEGDSKTPTFVPFSNN